MNFVEILLTTVFALLAKMELNVLCGDEVRFLGKQKMNVKLAYPFRYVSIIKRGRRLVSL